MYIVRTNKSKIQNFELFNFLKNNKNPRKLTPREATRLQGFPEEFIIPVSDTQAYKQFGNSVAVPVINKIAEQIIKILDKTKNC
nr:DNA cytosine methyltransferase [Mycoplasmopsis opalescens]